jgi:hypothetical protein
VAHKLARIVYHIVTTGKPFDPEVLVAQQERQRLYREARVRREAANLGYKLVPAKA